MKKRTFKIFALALTLILCLSGCGTDAPNAISETPTPTVTPKPPEGFQWDEEILKNDTGKTLIKCVTTKKEGDLHTSFGIVSEKGTVIVADPHQVFNENGLIRADLITVSHRHPDHNDVVYLRRLKDIATTLTKPTEENVTVNEVTAYGIAASHTSAPLGSNPTNIIFVYEVDGLRIAHMGDMGQDELLPDQLEKLGQLDIVFTVITHAPSYGPEKQKNIKILQQMKPKIILPTHYGETIVEETCEELGIEEIERAPSLAVSKEELEDAPTRLIILE